jgi:hypothetical protein
MPSNLRLLPFLRLFWPSTGCRLTSIIIVMKCCTNRRAFFPRLADMERHCGIATSRRLHGVSPHGTFRALPAFSKAWRLFGCSCAASRYALHALSAQKRRCREAYKPSTTCQHATINEAVQPYSHRTGHSCDLFFRVSSILREYFPCSQPHARVPLARNKQ